MTAFGRRRGSFPENRDLTAEERTALYSFAELYKVKILYWSEYEKLVKEAPERQWELSFTEVYITGVVNSTWMSDDTYTRHVKYLAVADELLFVMRAKVPQSTTPTAIVIQQIDYTPLRDDDAGCNVHFKFMMTRICN
jgi:hypothetical protein